MYQLYNYFVAFWSVVVMNCIQPVNWQYCLPAHEWFWPEFKQGVEIYFDKQHKMLYKSERDYLKEIQ